MSINLEEYTWHALYCPPQLELATGHQLSRHKFPVVIPAEKDWQDKRGHTREVYRAVIPRYVFTGFREPPNWEMIREMVPNVQGYMQFGGDGPSKIKLPDIRWLENLQEQLRGRQRPVEDVIRIGDTVRVIHGALQGHSVTVDKVVADRIHTIKSFLGAPRLFKISLAHVARI